MTAHRHEIPQPWGTLARIVAFPLAVTLLTVYAVGLWFAIAFDLAVGFARWLGEARPTWDDGVGGAAVDDGWEDESWPR